VTGLLRRSRARENDEIGQRDLLVALSRLLRI
jgi:hypothetical protein